MATTIEDVRVIFPDDTQLTDAQIQAAIDAATCSMERIESCLDGQGISDNCKDIICKYLAAHYAACTENTLSTSTETDACCGGSAKYGFVFGEGIMGTPFGQNANSISGGCVAALDAAQIGMYSLGCI